LCRLFNLVEVPDAGDVSHETALLVAAEAIRRMLVQPTVIWIEDLQWADTGTREVLPFIVERLGDVPLLVVANLRTGEAPPGWGRRTSVSALPLDPLGKDDAAALLRAILDGALPAQAEHALVAKAEGNPFYLSEIVATLRGRGTLARDGHGWRVMGRVEDVLPETVQAAVLARLDRLTPDLRTLVQRASAVGTMFRLSLLADLNPGIDVNGSLIQLEDAGFVLRTDPLAADPDYMFLHPLLREVAYASLLGKHQAALHRQIAQALERLYPAQREEMAKTIGTHYAQAGDGELALPYLVQAGGQAARRYAAREAIELLEQARRLGEPFGPTEASLMACELLGDLYLRVQDRRAKEWFAVWAYVRDNVDPAKDPLRWARATTRAAHALASDGRVAEAVMFLDEAEPVIPAEHPLQSDLLRVRAQTYVLQSQYRPALQAARRAVEVAGRVGTLSDRSRAYAVLANPALLPLLGEEGRAIMRAWVDEVAATGDERLWIEARHFLFSDIWTRGRVDADHLRMLEDARGKAEGFGWTRDESILSMLLGWAQFLTGRWPEADASLRHAHTLMETAGGRRHYQYEILLQDFRANVAMAGGRLDEARAVFEDALAHATYHAAIWLNHDLARCLIMQDSVVAAREAMVRSRAARDKFRCIICGCQADGVAAEFYATIGDVDAANALLGEAEDTAHSIGHAATLIRVHRTRARVALRGGAFDAALAAAQDALAVSATLPIPQPFEAALTQWLLGEVHASAGDRSAARSAWQQARATLSRLGAGWHLRHIDAALAQVL
jgi:tetratricopeptide (TPR) repeat protein